MEKRGDNAHRGRGAASSQLSQRFAPTRRETDGDWRDAMEALDGSPRPIRTTVTEENPATILSFNRSPDISFDRSINAYRGCEHGCVYCYARPTHAWHDLSPGLDFESRLFAKPNAAHLLRQALARPGYRPAPIAMGTNTDPYQPIEGRYRITRDILEICLEARHPVMITTKSDRILRDLDLLAELAQHDLIATTLSITTLDARLSGILEPRAASPAKRLGALAKLADAGIPTHVAVAPVIPAITDEFLESILSEASERGVGSASWIMLRLPHEVATLFREWLAVHFPERAGKVMAIVGSARAGRDNDPRFFSRMKPTGVWGDLIRERFRLACRRHGLSNALGTTLDCSHFRPPSQDGQLHLF